MPALAPVTVRFRAQTPFLFAVSVMLFLLVLSVHYVVLAFEAFRDAERQQLELKVLTRDAELRALRAQIDPHFLYNSLNSISALTGTDPAAARRMCLLLADFLRTTLRVSTQESITLAEELTLADRFLSIEQVRFGPRLQVERRIDETASQCRIPPLVLQPLLENAVGARHCRPDRRRHHPPRRRAAGRPVVDRGGEPAGCRRAAAHARQRRRPREREAPPVDRLRGRGTPRRRAGPERLPRRA